MLMRGEWKGAGSKFVEAREVESIVLHRFLFCSGSDLAGCNDHPARAAAKVGLSRWNELRGGQCMVEFAARRDSGHPSACSDSEVAISAASVIITGMERQRIIRWLRLLTSALCLILCALLVGLWVQTYHLSNSWKAQLTTARTISIFSFQGGMRVDIVTQSKPSDHVATGKSSFFVGGTIDNLVVKFPHWFLALFFLTLAALIIVGWQRCLCAIPNAVTKFASLERTGKLKWLRISMSAACVVVSGLLITFWLRSSTRADYVTVQITSTSAISALSAKGRLRVLAVRTKNQTKSNWTVLPHRSVKEMDSFGTGWAFEALAKNSIKTSGVAFIGAKAPSWFLVALSGALAFAPWLPCLPTRFSLRALLVVTTLVAVILGLGVWLARI